MISDVTQAAERAVASGATVAELDDLARQAGELDLTQPGTAEASTTEERARLAVLLDFLGLRAPAARLLVPVDRDGAAQVAGLRNIEGMLAARHGEYERAIGLFTQALGQAPNGSVLRTKILANRAAAYLQQGETTQAAESVALARAARRAVGDPAADVLLASVQSEVAASEGDLDGLRASVSALGEASRSRIAELGPQHPQALTTVANMAAAEFELACAEGAVDRQRRAAEVLEVAARRLGAELGADHPHALIALSNLHLADLVLARAAGQPRRVAGTLANLAAVAQRLSAVLGAAHPQARLAAANFATARAEASSASAQTGQRLAAPEAGGSAPSSRAGALRRAAGGPEVPTARKAALGRLALLDANEVGQVFRVSGFLLPDDAAALEYLEFTGDGAGRARAARAVVTFRASLPREDRDELDRYCAWPRALVTDGSGAVCGLLLPALPADYFGQQTDPASGRLTQRPRAMSWLTATEQQQAAAGADLPLVDHTDRLMLLAQLIYAVGRLHKSGWVFGDLSLGNAVFTLDPPRLMLVGCDGAAEEANPQRVSAFAPTWVPPECQDPGDRALPSRATDVYQLGLAIVRCLTPGPGASSARSVERLADLLDPAGTGLVTRTLAADPAQRPTAKELYRYVRGVVSARVAPPRLFYASLTTPFVPHGAEAHIAWQLDGATEVTVAVGDGSAITVDLAANVAGCAFRPGESGAVLVTASNRYGSVSVEACHVTLYRLPSIAEILPQLPAVELPSFEAFDLGHVNALLDSTPRLSERLIESLSLHPIELLDSMMAELPNLSSLQRLITSQERR